MKIVVFGCGTIAKRVTKGIKCVKELELYGFASKNIEKAKEYASLFDAPTFGNYERYLNDEDVKIIYIATYNPSHYELIKACLLKHKNVICEKPMLSSSIKVDELFKLAKDNNVLLMEAMKSLFLPLTFKIKEIVDSNILGDIKYASASFVRAETFDNSTHWIGDKETGGCLKDIGGYCASELNYLFGNPLESYAIKDDNPPRSAEVCIKYPNNILGHILVSNKIDGDSSLLIIGEKGYLKADNFWKESKAYYVIDNKKIEIKEELIDDFYYEINHFYNLVKEGKLESDIVSKDVINNILKITTL